MSLNVIPISTVAAWRSVDALAYGATTSTVAGLSDTWTGSGTTALDDFIAQWRSDQMPPAEPMDLSGPDPHKPLPGERIMTAGDVMYAQTMHRMEYAAPNGRTYSAAWVEGWADEGDAQAHALNVIAARSTILAQLADDANATA